MTERKKDNNWPIESLNDINAWNKQRKEGRKKWIKIMKEERKAGGNEEWLNERMNEQMHWLLDIDWLIDWLIGWLNERNEGMKNNGWLVRERLNGKIKEWKMNEWNDEWKNDWCEWADLQVVNHWMKVHELMQWNEIVFLKWVNEIKWKWRWKLKWMDEWMNEGMHVNEWKKWNEWMDERMDGWINEWVNEWMNEWMNDGMNERLNDKWTN